MNCSKKLVFFWFSIIVFLTTTCVFMYFVVPPLLIPYTSTRLYSLRRVMDFQTDLNRLHDKLREVETSQPKWVEEYRNHTDQIRSQLGSLSSVFEDYIHDYRSGFDIKIFDEFQIYISEIEVRQKTRTELLDSVPTVSSLRWSVFSGTNEFKMWAFEQDIDFLNTDGIILDNLGWDSSLSVEDAHTQVLNRLIDLIQLLESHEILRAQTLQDLKKAEPTINNIKRLEEWGMAKDLPKEQIETWLNRMIDPPLNQLKKIHVFMEEHGVTLGELSERVENKRNEIIGLFEKLEEKESTTFNELNQESQVDAETLKTLEDLFEKFKSNVMLRQSVDLDNNKKEL